MRVRNPGSIQIFRLKGEKVSERKAQHQSLMIHYHILGEDDQKL